MAVRGSSRDGPECRPPPPPPRRRVNRGLIWAAIITTIIGWVPMLCVWFAARFAHAHGCAVNEGAPNPCIVGGHDYGPLRYDFFVMGWLMLLTLPVLLASVVLWIVVLVQKVTAR